MRLLFQSDMKNGFLDLYESQGRLYVITALSKQARGVPVELPPEESADFAEAVLRGLDEATRASVIESVLKGERQAQHKSSEMV